MAKKNLLLTNLPFPVEDCLKRLGANLKTARLRRNLTIKEMAEKIGTGRKAVTEAEKGNPSSGIAVYAALLWAMDLLNPMTDIADPTKDQEGQRLASSREPGRARHSKQDLDNDF